MTAEHRRSSGRWILGMTLAFGASTLAVLGALALFHSVLAAGQFRLAELEQQASTTSEHLVDLQHQLTVLRSPGAVNRLGAEALGLEVATSPVHLRVVNRNLAATSGASRATQPDGTAGWLSIKRILSASAPPG